MSPNPTPLRALRAVLLLGALGPVLGALLGCSSPDLSGPGSPDPAKIPWRLALSATAITMDTLAPYDTLQLTATVLAADGTPLADAPAPTYVSSDSGVRVSPTGLLTARAPQAGVVIAASVVYQGIRLEATAVVAVTASPPTAPPPAFRAVSLTLLPGDSATFCMINCGFFGLALKTVQLAALDAAGQEIPLALMTPQVSTGKAEVQFAGARSWPGGVYGSGGVNIVPLLDAEPGPIVVRASATVYGVTRQDSLVLHLTLPLNVQFAVQKRVPAGSRTPVYGLSATSNETQVIGVGGTVMWLNATGGDTLDIAFDTPAAALPSPLPFFGTEGGDIAPYACAHFDYSCFRVRQFVTPGTYPFHSARTGIRGTIIVR